WFGAKDQPLQAARLISVTPIPFADVVVLGELEVVLPNHGESICEETDASTLANPPKRKLLGKRGRVGIVPGDRERQLVGFDV
ncbi:hypothetical protein ACC754_41815, partial [Rhizobium johnstonii]